MYISSRGAAESVCCSVEVRLTTGVRCRSKVTIHPSSSTKSTEHFDLSVEFRGRARSKRDHTQPLRGVQRLSLSKGDYGGKPELQTFPHCLSISRQTAGGTVRIQKAAGQGHFQVRMEAKAGGRPHGPHSRWRFSCLPFIRLKYILFFCAIESRGKAV